MAIDETDLLEGDLDPSNLTPGAGDLPTPEPAPEPPETKKEPINIGKAIKDDPMAFIASMIPGYASGYDARQNQGTEAFSVGDLFSQLGPVAYESAYYMPILGTVMGAPASYDMIATGQGFLTKTLGVLGFAGVAEVLPVPAAPKRN